MLGGSSPCFTQISMDGNLEWMGGLVWAGSPWDFLPLPLLLSFFLAMSAKDTAQDGTGCAPGLSLLPLEEVGLTKCPLFLTMTYWRMSSAKITFP